jgi:integrase
MSSRNPNRVPVESRGRRIPGLYQRHHADGNGSVYEYVGRLNGRVRTVKLDAQTKSDAIDEVESLRSGVREKRIEISADRRKTVRDAVTEYLAHLESLDGTRGAKSPRTLEDIEDKLDLYVLPAIGHLPVAAISDRDIEQLARSARHRSESTVRSILSTCSQLFAWAMRQRYCDHNPVKRAREIHGDTLLPVWTPKPQRALTDDEVLAALGHVGESFRPTVAFTAETGLRISEVLALRWADVDLDEGALVVASTKTKSTREIGISSAAVEVLREHRARMRSSSLVGIAAIAPDALIFQTRTGRPQSRRNVLRAWQEALAEIGIEGCGLHTLRHSFISRLEERGVSVAIAAELVGHSRVTTTQAVYTRMRGGREAKLAAQREALRSASS